MCMPNLTKSSNVTNSTRIYKRTAFKWIISLRGKTQFLVFFTQLSNVHLPHRINSQLEELLLRNEYSSFKYHHHLVAEAWIDEESAIARKSHYKLIHSISFSGFRTDPKNMTVQYWVNGVGIKLFFATKFSPPTTTVFTTTSHLRYSNFIILRN
jgi:hypothetical protein